MVVTNTIIVLCSIIAFLIAGFAAYLFWAQRKFGELEAAAEGAAKNVDKTSLKLGALERLTLFAERSKLDNLVNRLFESQLTAREMQQTLTAAIRQEYEHNVTQQLYVEPQIWEAITKMKDQNLYIINQLGTLLPPQANALDLNKKILEFVLNNPDATMNKIVLEAIQFESRKLLA